MTDEQIIKALDCCINAECQICPLYDNDAIAENCPTGLLKLCANLINRQKAEIERLQKAKADDVSLAYKLAKSEAIKEFAERIKQEINFPLAVWKVFDNLVKEMTEVNDDERCYIHKQ